MAGRRRWAARERERRVEAVERRPEKEGWERRVEEGREVCRVRMAWEREREGEEEEAMVWEKRE